MDKVNNCDNLQQSEEEFKKWLKKYHEQLTIRNQCLKSHLSSKQEINIELKKKIETLLNNSIDASGLAVDIIPNKVQMQLQVTVNSLQIKSEQLQKCIGAINAKAEDETQKMHSKFYEMLTKDEVELKPYHEVEGVIKDLSLKTDFCRKVQNENKEKFIEKLEEKEYYFNEIQQSILLMEPIEQEMRFSIQNCKKMFDAKLKFLKLKSFEDANDESNESKELLADISNMKGQLYLK